MTERSVDPSCASCQKSVSPADERRSCRGCAVEYHDPCGLALPRCVTSGCDGAGVWPPERIARAADVRAAPLRKAKPVDSATRAGYVVLVGFLVGLAGLVWHTGGLHALKVLGFGLGIGGLVVLVGIAKVYQYGSHFHAHGRATDDDDLE